MLGVPGRSSKWDCASIQRLRLNSMEPLEEVDINEFERAHQFVWTVASDGSDPLLAKRLEAKLDLHLADWLRALDDILAHMPGLAPPHCSPSQTAQHEGNQAVRLLWHRLRHCYARAPVQGATNLAAVAGTIADQVAAEWVPAALDRIQQQVEATRALQRLCAAVIEQRDVAVQVHTDAQLLDTFVDMAPQQLQSELAQSHVPFEALVDVLRTDTIPGGSGASCLGPSLAVRTRAVVEWVARHALPVQQACLTVLATLNELRRNDAAHPCWCGVHLKHVSDVTQTEHQQLRAAAVPRLGQPHTKTEIALVADAVCEPVALRPIRLARIVECLAVSGRLRPRCISAAEVEGLLHRASVEAAARQRLDHTDGVVQGGAEPVRHACAYVHARSVRSSPPPQPQPPPPPPAPTAPPPPPLPALPTLLTDVATDSSTALREARAFVPHIDEALRIDAAVLAALGAALACEAARAPSGYAVVLLKKMDGDVGTILTTLWATKTVTARRLSIGQALRTRVLPKFKEYMTKSGSPMCGTAQVAYRTTDGCAGMGVVANAAGRDALRTFTDEMLLRMRTQCKSTSLAWYNNAQARSRARKRVVG